MAVVTHPGDDLASGRYVISRLVTEWEAMDLQVSVVDDPARAAGVDVAIVPTGAQLRMAGELPVVCAAVWT